MNYPNIIDEENQQGVMPVPLKEWEVRWLVVALDLMEPHFAVHDNQLAERRRREILGALRNALAAKHPRQRTGRMIDL